MANGLRLAGLAVGGALFAGGLALHAMTGHGYGLIFGAAIVVASVLIERRYRSTSATNDLAPHRWDPTTERFFDPESGVAMQVWLDPLTGERRYQSVEGLGSSRD